MLSTHGYFDATPQLGQTDTGGQVVYVLELSQALARIGIHVDIYTRWFDPAEAQIEIIPDCPKVRIIRIPAGPMEFIPKEQLYERLPELAENLIKFVELNNIEYDLFHGHYVDAGVVAVEVAKRLNKPVFFTSHSLGALKRKLMNGYSKAMEKKYRFELRISKEREIFQSVTAQTATAHGQIDIMESLYGLRLENVEIIPPGVNIDTYNPRENQYKLGIDADYVLCISRIDETKGHIPLLEAFALVHKEIPDIHLVIGGGSTKPKGREKNLLNRMRELIRKEGMDDVVHLVGYVPDEEMNPYYQQAKIFILPSVSEPFGMTPLEAMACGTPTVISEFAGVTEFLTDQKHCLIIDPTNETQLAMAITSLLKNKLKADEIAEAGMKFTRKNFSWDAIAHKHMEFYSKFLLN